MNIVVTGGTGTIGSAFVVRMLEYGHSVTVYSRCEVKQRDMYDSLPRYRGNLRMVIGDVRDRNAIAGAVRNADVVLHTAAMKMIDTAEYNPVQCYDVNVNGTKAVVDACIQNGVKRLLNMSTDKASSPMSAYGASKLLAEKVVQAANLYGDTIASSVRFGNFWGSRGSVVPYFKSLVDSGAEKLPLTHPEVNRFFITVDDGVSFISNVFEIMRGGEVFIPKMKTVFIRDLIEAFGRESEIVGLRTNEKIREETFSHDEARLVCDAGDYYFISPTIELPSRRVSFKYEDIAGVDPGSQYAAGRYTVDELRGMI